MQRLMSRALVEAFKRLQENVVKERQMRIKTLAAVLTVARRLMSRALVESFERWRDSVVEERQAKAKALKVMQRLMRRALAEGFGAFVCRLDEGAQGHSFNFSTANRNSDGAEGTPYFFP